ncbi:MAG TPA: hypothetical protein VJH37_05135 [Candidatus Nanoarchaeia archaeon]|nr:hypothetical protein [Candidatus Nanoarchaeia archaeon]
MEQEFVARRIESLESEIEKLKKWTLPKRKKKIVSLKGMLKGIKFTEEDIKEAKSHYFDNNLDTIVTSSLIVLCVH